MWYRGHKLNLQRLLANCESLRRENRRGRDGGRNRAYVVCEVYQNQEETAIKVSVNGVVYAASGMLVEGVEKLCRVVDNLLGRPHQAAVEAQKLEDMWKRQGGGHP